MLDLMTFFQPESDGGKRKDPKIASVTKIERHPNDVSNQPPSNGARIGANPITSISMENARADSRAVVRSRTIAIGMTMPAQPPMPCRKRKINSIVTLPDKAQPIEANA